MDILDQKYIDNVILKSTGIETADYFRSIRRNLMKAFSTVLDKDEQIFDLKFNSSKELHVSLIALDQGEEEDLKSAIRNGKFNENLNTEIAKDPDLAGVDLKKDETTDAKLLNWLFISGNTNLIFM